MEMDNGTSDSEFILASRNSKKIWALLSDLLMQEVTEQLFQKILDLGIQSVSIAKAGSMMLLLGQHYHFVAAYSYDLQELKKVTLRLDESIVSAEPQRAAFVLRDLKGFNSTKLDIERQQILQRATGRNKIKETLVVPVYQQGQIIATLALDNIDSNSTFTKQHIFMGERLGLILGLGLKLQNYQMTKFENRGASSKLSKTVDISLCPRDLDILQCICDGLSDKQIAQKLGLELSTTKNYVKRLYRTIGVNRRTQAVKWADEQGLKRV
ncbi:MAG: response regulator transcription factor [Trueperaceae bacterium]